jgi:hypothetical protein
MFQIVCAHVRPVAYHQVEELWLSIDGLGPKCIAGVIYKYKGQSTLSPFAFSWELGTVKLTGKRRLVRKIARFLVQHSYVLKEAPFKLDFNNLDQDYPRSNPFGGQQVTFTLSGPDRSTPGCLACPSYLACVLVHA